MNSKKMKTQATRRQFLGAAAAAATLTIVPRHVLGGPKSWRAERQGQHRHRRRRRPGPHQRPESVPGRGRPDHRRLRCGREDRPERVLLRGIGRTGDGQGRGREALRKDDARLPLRGVRRLPRDAGEGEGDRRHALRHARSRPCRRGDHRDEAGQARLLREAAGAQHLGGPAGGPGGQGNRRGHADGQPGPLGRRHPADVRVDLGRRDRPGARSPCLERHGQMGDKAPAGRTRRRRCRPGSTGTCGWARARCGRITRPTRRTTGAAGGPSAPGPSATWPATTSTRPCGR